MAARERFAIAIVLSLVASCGMGGGSVDPAGAPETTDTPEPAGTAVESAVTPWATTEIGEKRAEPTRLRAPRQFPPSEWVIGEPRREVFLTFDGIPRTGALPQILHALERHEAKGAFFVPGIWLRAHERSASSIVDAGHVLGNRGFWTTPFTKLRPDRLRASINNGESAVAALGADPRPYLRPPRGGRDRRVLELAGRLGYRAIRWTVRGGIGSAARVAERIATEARPGAIVSLDLWRRSHVRALPLVLRKLRREELRTASLDRLRDARAIRWDLEITPGWKGEVVRFIQSRLSAATYPAGSPDGTFGAATLHAVYAFQKVHELERDARLSPEEMEMIALSRPPDPPRPGEGSYIDIDITRQVLFEVQSGEVVNTFPISSASGATYVSDGELRISSTPRGEFTFERKIPGWHESDLGSLYYPLYFYGGYAVHGSTSVPPYPASHGCIRLPLHVAADFYARHGLGTQVFVHD